MDIGRRRSEIHFFQTDANYASMRKYRRPRRNALPPRFLATRVRGRAPAPVEPVARPPGKSKDAEPPDPGGTEPLGSYKCKFTSPAAARTPEPAPASVASQIPPPSLTQGPSPFITHNEFADLHGQLQAEL